MPRATLPLVVSGDEEKQIEQWFGALGTPQQVALRCRLVLAGGRGESEAAMAAELQVNRKTVRLWKERFSREGLRSLWRSRQVADARRRMERIASNR